jgi:hypothetical protein
MWNNTEIVPSNVVALIGLSIFGPVIAAIKASCQCPSAPRLGGCIWWQTEIKLYYVVANWFDVTRHFSLISVLNYGHQASTMYRQTAKRKGKFNAFFICRNNSVNFDSLDSSVSIMTMVCTEQPRNYGSIPERGKRFFVAPNVQTGSGVHPVSY